MVESQLSGLQMKSKDKQARKTFLDNYQACGEEVFGIHKLPECNEEGLAFVEIREQAIVDEEIESRLPFICLILWL